MEDLFDKHFWDEHSENLHIMGLESSMDYHVAQYKKKFMFARELEKEISFILEPHNLNIDRNKISVGNYIIPQKQEIKFVSIEYSKRDNANKTFTLSGIAPISSIIDEWSPFHLMHAKTITNTYKESTPYGLAYTAIGIDWGMKSLAPLKNHIICDCGATSTSFKDKHYAWCSSNKGDSK